MKDAIKILEKHEPYNVYLTKRKDLNTEKWIFDFFKVTKESKAPELITKIIID
jgi:hypothetical protein